MNLGEEGDVDDPESAGHILHREIARKQNELSALQKRRIAREKRLLEVQGHIDEALELNQSYTLKLQHIKVMHLSQH